MNLMMLMDSVVPHNPFDHLFDGPAAALRCAGIGSDWNRIGSDGRLRCVTGMPRLSMVGVPFHRARSSRIDRHDHQSVCTLPFGLAHTIHSTPCVYEQPDGHQQRLPLSSTHFRHSLTGLPRSDLSIRTLRELVPPLLQLVLVVLCYGRALR